MLTKFRKIDWEWNRLDLLYVPNQIQMLKQARIIVGYQFDWGQPLLSKSMAIKHAFLWNAIKAI